LLIFEFAALRASCSWPTFTRQIQSNKYETEETSKRKTKKKTHIRINL